MNKKREHVNSSAIRPTSKDTGEPAQNILDLYDAKMTARNAKKFGRQSKIPGEGSQDDKSIIVCANDSLKWSEKMLTEPRLGELVFTRKDLPEYLFIGCEDLSDKQVKAIVRKRGVRGKAWSSKYFSQLDRP